MTLSALPTCWLLLGTGCIGVRQKVEGQARQARQNLEKSHIHRSLKPSVLVSKARFPLGPSPVETGPSPLTGPSTARPWRVQWELGGDAKWRDATADGNGPVAVRARFEDMGIFMFWWETGPFVAVASADYFAFQLDLYCKYGVNVIGDGCDMFTR